jgi:hypothetical protein
MNGHPACLTATHHAAEVVQEAVVTGRIDDDTGPIARLP